MFCFVIVFCFHIFTESLLLTLKFKIMGFGFKKRWTPSKAQKRAFHEKMVAIETAKEEEKIPDDYLIRCTGDCCKGDEIAFFNAGKSSERFYGKIINESYGASKQQHTFTIELLDGDKMLIKGRNLYKNGVVRKAWLNEQDRIIALNEKHERGENARDEARIRRANKANAILAEFEMD